MFGVPEGMRLVPLERPQRSYQVGLVLADRDPEPMLARALLDVARLVDMPGELNRAARRHLNNPRPESRPRLACGLDTLFLDRSEL
jgi:hypothetical protein